MNMSKITMLQTKIWLYIAVFGSCIIVASWLLQVVFFDAAYINREKYTVENLGRNLTEEYKDREVFVPTYLKYYEDEIPVRIFNRPGVGSATAVLELSEPDPLNIDTFIDKYELLESQGKTELIELVEDPNVANSSFFIYGTKLLNEASPEYSLYIYVISPLGARGSTQEVLRQQLFFVVIFFVLLSILVSYFISSQIAKPMLKLTETAQALAGGDYDVEFKSDDYTEISDLANVLNYAKTELEKSDQLKTQLMANVSHDLRTPLTMIKAYAEMIRDLSGDNPEKRKEHIRVIIQEADWMSDLITDILEYSRIQSGNIKYDMQPFDLCSLTVENVAQFTDFALKSGIKIELKCPEEGIVTGDMKMINRVIRNLISNAVNHSDTDSEITIAITSKEGSGKARWEVRDYGSGIEPEKLGQIWNSYFSSGGANKRLASGTGLGLSIVHGILTAHKAEFGVDSRLGEGTVFWFEL